MGFDGAGGYSRTHNFSADASANVKILAARMDAEFDDFASAIALARLRDGQNSPTANLPMGGFIHTGVGAPASATNYIRAQDFIRNVPIYMLDTTTSADNISVSATFFVTASADAAPPGGTKVIIKALSNKSSVPAIHLNAGFGTAHSANVQLQDGGQLYSGAIFSGGIYEFIFSSAASVWHLMNPTIRAATTAGQGVIEIATTAEGLTGTDTTRAVTPAVMAAKFSADAATTASAGLIELATTAEVSLGTDTERAITPSGLMTQPFIPIGVVIACTQQSASSVSAEILYATKKASAWTVSASTTAGGIRVGYDFTLTSANAICISLTNHAELADDRLMIPLMFRTSTDGFKFNFVDVSSQDFSNFPSSANVHVQVIR